MTEYNTLGEALDARKVKNAAQAKRERYMREGEKVKDLTPEQFATKYADRRRSGKTERDHANGNKARNHARKMARADWQKNANKTNPAPFPV